MKPSLPRRKFLQDSGLNVALMVIGSRQSQPPRPAVSPKLEPSEKVFLKTWDLVELPNLAISLRTSAKWCYDHRHSPCLLEKGSGSATTTTSPLAKREGSPRQLPLLPSPFGRGVGGEGYRTTGTGLLAPASPGFSDGPHSAAMPVGLGSGIVPHPARGTRHPRSERNGQG